MEECVCVGGWEGSSQRWKGQSAALIRISFQECLLLSDDAIGMQGIDGAPSLVAAPSSLPGPLWGDSGEGALQSVTD